MKLAFQMPRLSLLWILSAIVVILLPQITRLPWWVSALSILCVIWRIGIFSGRLSFPSKTVRFLLVALSIALTTWQYSGATLGLDTAVSVLVLGVFFKTLEMRDKRDIAIVVCMSYVLIMVGFIYSQTILSTLHALLCIVMSTGALVSVSRDNANNTLNRNLRLSTRIVLQAIPLTIVLFLLVPRIAPLWSMPLPSPSNTTGVSDEMSPGDIGRLGRSAELAFRVGFDEDIPAHSQLYWRGLVLEAFDGRAWSRNRSSFALARRMSGEPVQLQVATRGEATGYDVILEPTQQHWIYALHLADFDNADVYRDRNYVLYLANPITQRYRYKMQSFLQNQTDVQISDYARRINLALPAQDPNSRTQEFVSQLFSSASDERDYIDRVLSHFREQEFFYTLSPSLLGEASVDEFLFDTREGFCEHYASSFVYMMRAAGIPARVVVGYQGGEYNPYENYTMVYQYNAHAWAEVWLEGEGWLRVDPTAAVAPERINMGVEAVLGSQPGFLEDSRFSMMRFRNNAWLNSLRLRMDAMDYAWNQWVVSYDEDLQLSLFEDLFGEQAKTTVLWVLFLSVAMVFSFLAFVVLRTGRRAQLDPATRVYLNLLKDLRKSGIERRVGEGPRAFADRVCERRPDLAVAMTEFTQQYMRLNYMETDQDSEKRKASLQALSAAAWQLRLQALTGLDRLVLRLSPWR
ncbi:MAG: DUF3488 and transglutaminase-like domain-containing protein [Pseudohongiellaceae bacterium]|nr:DUF3488 and transglutaminase-like domain-containing protein [Pseudohongiellaceae bacterium]